MKKKTRTGVIITIEVVVAVLIAAMALFMAFNVTVNGALYPRFKEELDLTDKPLTAAEVQKLREKLPDTEILWMIPLESGPVRSDAAQITLTTLSDEDLALTDYLTNLQTVHAENCRDSAQLAVLQQRHPQAVMYYSVWLGEEQFSPDAASVSVIGMTEADIPALAAFRNLSKLTIAGGSELSLLPQIQEAYPQLAVDYSVTIGGKTYPGDTRELVLMDLTYDEIVDALTLLPELKNLDLINPIATADQLTALRETYTDTKLIWQVQAYGMFFGEDTVEMNLSGAEGLDLKDVEIYADCLPNLERLYLGECGLDNEELAALRESKRDSYKVVWTIRFTQKLAADTDVTTFMPGHKDIGEYRFNESMGVNVQDLKYFEDIECMDLGHFNIYKADFLAYMPHLKFLILSWTEIHDLSPIVNCQELIYLELDWSQVRDFTPLVELKALQDLNVCGTVADVTPLTQMTWLKNLWAAERGYSAKKILLDAFPQEDVLGEEDEVLIPKSDTYLYIYGGSTSAWRHLPHYYEMRDILGMYYMDQ